MGNFEVDPYIKITISILGIAYPILFQITSRLDEKYSSTIIVELFDREWSKKWFKYLLFFTLAAIVVWSLKLQPLFEPEWCHFLIDNSADILVMTSVTALVGVFFFYVQRILIYYTPAKFINYLIAKYAKGNNLLYFNALSDVFLHSVQKQNRNISQTILRFLFDAFRNEQEKSSLKPVEFPEAFYSLVYKTIEELAIIKNKKDIHLESTMSGGILLFGDISESGISEITYRWLWRNILLAITYERDDLIMHHWERAHQYYWMNIPYINLDSEYADGKHTIKNKAEIIRRKEEKEKFLEFHYALGGLLLYKNRYACLQRIFTYTNSQPPKYELLPDSMNEIFDWYYKFRDPYDVKYSWLSHKYYFPDQSGLGADPVIKGWISSYIAVLLLREYSIWPYLITMRPLDIPNTPTTQSGKKEWLNGLDFLKKLVEDSLNNSELIKQLKFDFLTREWCVEQMKTYPLDLIDNLRNQLEREYEAGAKNMEVSPEKATEFYEVTKEILDEKLSSYKSINAVQYISDNYNEWFLGGKRMTQSKDAFSENPEIHHMNYDSILASLLSNEIEYRISFLFNYHITKGYLLTPDDIFKGIEKLGIDDTFLIVALGVNINKYVDIHKINGLSTNYFNGIQIISYRGISNVGRGFFIIRKADLPSITTNELAQEIIDKYTLVLVSERNKIYASVIDLNLSSQEILNENIQEKTLDELKKSVLMTIAFNLQIRWKRGVEVIRLMEYSQYQENGRPNTLEDIKGIENE